MPTTLTTDEYGPDGDPFRLMKRYTPGDEHPVPFHLYEVRLTYPNVKGVPVTVVEFCMAESEEKAIDQVRCAHSVSTYTPKPFLESDIIGAAHRVKMILQGWGDARF